MNANILHVPRGIPGLSPLALDLNEVNSAEQRIQEVALVTRVKAPELMALFNRTYLTISAMVSTLELESVNARRAADRARAVVLIDKMPSILRERGLSTAKSPMGSEDIRQAILSLDTEYAQAKDACEVIEAYMQLLKTKAKGIEMAYTAVKKILGDQTGGYGSGIGNNTQRAGNEDENLTAGQTTAGFSKNNRYQY